MSIDIDHLRSWIGREECAEDVITPVPVAALAATLDRDDLKPRPGDELPPLWHWLYFLPMVRQSELGPDGHPKTRRLSAACSPAAPDVGRRAVRIPPAFAHRRIHRAQVHDRGCVC